MPAAEPRNPFYMLLLLASLACVVLEEKAIAMGENPPPSPFRDALRNDGGRWLLYEVAAMIVFGIASMFLDRCRRYCDSKTAVVISGSDRPAEPAPSADRTS